LHPSSQPLFVFPRTDPITHYTQQLNWTVLPQGFRDSFHLFGQALQQDLNLSSLNLFSSKLIQYVDDLLLYSLSRSVCKPHSIILFNSLKHWGYWVSKNKAQLLSTSITFMEHLLTPGYCQIPQNRKTSIIQIPSLERKRDILSFLE
jgi:hypothetical protein